MFAEGEERYVIEQGDCVSSVAEKFGFFSATVWDYAGNSELRKLRKDPNILYPGDILVIPPKEIKEYVCETGKKHTFIKKAEKTKFSLRLLQEGKPRSGVSFILSIGSFKEKGKTDSDGFVNAEIPSNATRGKLSILHKDEIVEEYEIELGHLDPLDEIAGIQKRLKNLGFECDESGELDKRTNASIAAFRSKHNLQGEGIDEQFVAKLKEIHGS